MSVRRGLRALVVAGIGLSLTLVGCGSAPADQPSGSASPAGPSSQATGTLTVFAAASLNKAFDDLGKAFEATHPGVKVRFSYDGSSSLVDQLSGGAPADVLATADTPTMDRAVKDGLINGQPTRFASNQLVLIVPKGNPGQVKGLDDSLDGKKLVICQVKVPCGAATAKLAEQLKVTLKPVSEESKVTDVRGKVESGEADAGLVYTTDAKASGDKVEVISIPGAEQVINSYPIAPVKDAANAALAAQFIALVSSDQGQQVLAGYGFSKP